MVFENRQKELPTYWLNGIRFLSVLYVLWTHYEYLVFAEVHPSGINIEKIFFEPPALSSWLLYGYTGKYAVAVLCVISGFVTACSLDHKKEIHIWDYCLKRYLRIMLPVMGMGMFTLIYMKMSGENMPITDILTGIFCPGSRVFYGYFWCLSAFLIGNYAVLLCKKLINMKWEKSLGGGILLVVLVLVNYAIWYKLYIWDLVWATSVIAGYCLYELVNRYEIHIPYIFLLILLGICWWLPRGEESLKIYIRDAISACILLMIMFNTQWIYRLNSICKKRHISNIFKYSYSLYVVHGFSLEYFACDMLSSIQYITNNWWLSYLVAFGLKTLFDFLLAIFFYHLFEKMLYKKCCAITEQVLKY